MLPEKDHNVSDILLFRLFYCLIKLRNKQRKTWYIKFLVFQFEQILSYIFNSDMIDVWIKYFSFDHRAVTRN